MLVVYYHASIQVNSFEMGEDRLVQFGKCGVDLFFVLSGFLMWQSTKNKSYPILTFYRRRLLRIAPLYWLLTSTAGMIALIDPDLLHSTRFEGSHFIASLAFLPWPNPASHGSMTDLMTPLIVPGWTLNFEMMFYALFGLSLLGALKWRTARLAFIFGLFILLVVKLREQSLALSFYDPFLILEFLLGVAVAMVIDRKIFPPVGLAWILLIVSFSLLIILDIHFLQISRFFVSGIPAALIIYSLNVIESAGSWPPLKWAAAAGDASFSIYLIHIFVLAGLRVTLHPALNDVDLDLSRFIFVLSSLALSLMAGLLTFRYVEGPLGRLAARLPGIPWDRRFQRATS